MDFACRYPAMLSCDTSILQNHWKMMLKQLLLSGNSALCIEERIWRCKWRKNWSHAMKVTAVWFKTDVWNDSSQDTIPVFLSACVSHSSCRDGSAAPAASAELLHNRTQYLEIKQSRCQLCCSTPDTALSAQEPPMHWQQKCWRERQGRWLKAEATVQ